MCNFGRMFKKYLKSTNSALPRKLGLGLLAYTVKENSAFYHTSQRCSGSYTRIWTNGIVIPTHGIVPDPAHQLSVDPRGCRCLWSHRPQCWSDWPTLILLCEFLSLALPRYFSSYEIPNSLLSALRSLSSLPLYTLSLNTPAHRHPSALQNPLALPG